MHTVFTGKGTETPDGYSFQVSFLGHEIACHISSEALQDIDPDNRFNPREQQFRDNQQHVLTLVEKAIVAAASIPSAVRIP
ncbi:MAG: hypothetical protein WBF84_03015 [Castellaniella sp.]|uniref:hypothetical protein n=1 Tax=Castellaniella sp. TaxID=1955812 RepID=UPI003C7264C2